MSSTQRTDPTPEPVRADLLARMTSAREHRHAGDYPASARVLREAVAAAEAALGPAAAELGVLLNELGIVGKYAGDFPTAEAAYRRALDIEERRGARGGANAASLLHNLAGLAHARGDAETALRLAHQGIEIRAALACPDPQGLAADRAALAAILVDLRRFGEARSVLDETLRGGVPRYDTAVALHNLGSARFREGHPGRAAVLLRRALVLKRAELGADHPDLAVTLHNLGRCLEALGWRRMARRQWLRAVAVLDGAVAVDHPTLIACRRHLAGGQPKRGSSPDDQQNPQNRRGRRDRRRVADHRDDLPEGGPATGGVAGDVASAAQPSAALNPPTLERETHATR